MSVTFQAISWQEQDELEDKYEDSDDEETNESQDDVTKQYKISIFGRTHDNRSVCLRTSFDPYFFIEIPQNWDTQELKNFIFVFKKRLGKYSVCFKDWKVVLRKKYYGFTNHATFKFVRLVFKNITTYNKAKYALKNGIHYNGKIHSFGPIQLNNETSTITKIYEANISPMLRFAHVQDLQLSSNVTIEEDFLKHVSKYDRYSKCDIEIEVHWKNIKQDSSVDKIAPLVQASFDIETYSPDGSFPDPHKKECAVLQVATTFQNYGSSSMDRVLIVVGKCDLIDDVTIIQCATEKELLERWAREINKRSVDVLIGYNIWKFDLYYMHVRAQITSAESFFNIGKVVDYHSEIKDASFSSSAYGDNHYKMVHTPGMFQIDLLVIMQREHKLVSYSLNSVSEHFLKDKKVDMPYKEMFKKLIGSPSDIREVGIYCVKDTELPQLLVNKLAIIPNMVEMSKATWVPLSYLIERGQGIKAYSQLLYQTRKEGMLVVTLEQINKGYKYFEEEQKKEYPSLREKDIKDKWWDLKKDEKTTYTNLGKSKYADDDYEGATVLSALAGAYMNNPITGLDFASLYPTIMRAHNLDHSTLVLDSSYDNLEDVEYYEIDGHKFAQNVEGIIPKMLKLLAQNRKAAKKQMAEAEKNGDKFMKALYNGKQLAFKVSMNSIYGFCGASVGMLPCKPVASCTTSIGRNMIAHTKKLVEEWYPGAIVVYGDTDSVMVKFNTGDLEGNDAIKRSFELGNEAAERISATFKKPIDLEFEKVYCPYLLFSKKRYAGLMYTNPEKPDYIDAKGIQLVRRDNCPFVKDVSQNVLNMIMYKKDIKNAMELVREKAKLLLENKVKIEDLVVSKSMKDNYKNTNQPHLIVAKKIEQREPGSGPKSGERIPYVFLDTGNKKHKQFEKAEDPEYAKLHNLSLDLEYYLEHGLSSPVEGLFKLFMNEPKKELFDELLEEYHESKKKKLDIRKFFYV